MVFSFLGIQIKNNYAIALYHIINLLLEPLYIGTQCCTPLFLFTFKFRKGLSIITLLSNRLCEGNVYKLFYYPVLHSRPILLDMHTWARAIHYGFLKLFCR